MLVPPPVLALSPGNLTPEGALAFVSAAAAAYDGGLRALVLREPTLEDGALLPLARRLRAIFGRGAAFFAVHDRVHVALLAEADGVHLGWRSLSVEDTREAARRGAPDRPLAVSVSTHAGDTEDRYGGADWVVHGPVGDVPDKSVALPPIGFGGLARFALEHPVPTFALGGLGPRDAAACRAAGARGMAVRRALWQGAAGPHASARALVEAWGDA